LNNYKLTIQYDGTNFAGWQIQNNAVTVQQKISELVKIILKEDINLIGSGRTDSGVHALGQVANFRTENEIDIFRFKHSLNSILPADISVTGMTKVKENFHARFDAKKRSYLYLLSLKKSPFYKNYSWFYHDEINIAELNRLSVVLIGEHDFTSFSRKNTEIENKDCIIYSVHWRMSGDIVYFLIEANRYLHGMVRTIVGTLLKLAKEDDSEKKLSEILNLKDRETAGEAAPAKGLFLYKVKY
jgi:tRNA pseudouridine38-40 synthase